MDLTLASKTRERPGNYRKTSIPRATLIYAIEKMPKELPQKVMVKQGIFILFRKYFLLLL
jgi:hypothetical protein